MQVRLWFVKETEKARYYSKLPASRHPGEEDHVWVPRSLVTHTTKYPDGQHVIDVADWFAEKNNL